MTVTGTLVSYYHFCKRRMWLFANGINMEHTSETVADGKLLHETSYPQRAEKYSEIAIGGSKIDFYDAKNKMIHEIKKSDSFEEAHEWQVKYYIWLLEQNGVEGVKGIIEYPKLRETKQVTLSVDDKMYLAEVVQQIELLVKSETCPPRIEKKFCKSCSYFDFCWVGE